MKYIINYTKEGKILGFYNKEQLTDLNIEVSNAIWFEAQSFNKIIADGKNISFDKVDWRTPEEIEQETQAQVRAERDRLIESVRWRIERHRDEIALGNEPTEPLKPLLQYTQALRDVPQQAGFPTTHEMPETPEWLN